MRAGRALSQELRRAANVPGPGGGRESLPQSELWPRGAHPRVPRPLVRRARRPARPRRAQCGLRRAGNMNLFLNINAIR